MYIKGSYYNIQQHVFNLIEDLIKNSEKHGIEPELLMYEITKSYPVGSKTVNERIVLLKKLGKIQEKMGVLVWKG